MGIPGRPRPVKRILGMLSPEEELLRTAPTALGWGEVDYESLIIPFTWSTYYEEEMGPNLLRRFVSFRNLVFPEVMVEDKGSIVQNTSKN